MYTCWYSHIFLDKLGQSRCKMLSNWALIMQICMCLIVSWEYSRLWWVFMSMCDSWINLNTCISICRHGAQNGSFTPTSHRCNDLILHHWHQQEFYHWFQWVGWGPKLLHKVKHSRKIRPIVSANLSFLTDIFKW